tara:strand:- start:1543 stop:2109 length:567 start_codon:yes stop_codon:yes gene_type:complete
MIEYKLDNVTCMGGWYIPEKICDDLIDLYNKNISNTIKGTLGYEYIPEKKQSTEFIIPFENNFSAITNYNAHLKNVLSEYKNKYPFSDKVSKFQINEHIKIQHYKPTEGYYTWHAENVGTERQRHLVFMTYLNTVENAGTEFHHQDLTTPCKKGLTLIWPSAWTHLHRGVTNMNYDKYIITGWYGFEK